MKLVQRSSIFAAACVGAVVASAACNKTLPERDSREGRDRDLEDKSGAPRPGERVGTTTLTGAELGAGSLSNGVVTQRIVEARCARETACNNIGPDKHFVDRSVCERTLGERMGNDLQPSACPRGIDSDAANRCMEATRLEDCNNPIDTISRIAACRATELCLK